MARRDPRSGTELFRVTAAEITPSSSSFEGTHRYIRRASRDGILITKSGSKSSAPRTILSLAIRTSATLQGSLSQMRRLSSSCCWEAIDGLFHSTSTMRAQSSSKSEVGIVAVAVDNNSNKICTWASNCHRLMECANQCIATSIGGINVGWSLWYNYFNEGQNEEDF